MGHVVIGLDSAEMTGVAILDGDRLVRHAVVQIADWSDDAAGLAWYGAHHALPCPSVVAGRRSSSLAPKSVPNADANGSVWQSKRPFQEGTS